MRHVDPVGPVGVAGSAGPAGAERPERAGRPSSEYPNPAPGSLGPQEPQYVWPLRVALLLIALNMTIAIGLGYVLGSGSISIPEGDVGTLLYFILYLSPYAIVLSLVWVYMQNREWRPSEALGLRRFDVTEGVAVALAVAVGGRILATGWGMLVSSAGFEPPQELDITRMMPSDALGVTLLVLLVVFLGPLAEEVLFRGILYPALRARNGVRSAMVLSGILFGLIHVDLLWLVVPTAILGVALAWLYEYTGSLWVSFMCHAVFNLTALALAFLAKALGVV